MTPYGFRPNFERKCNYCPEVFRFEPEQEYYCSSACAHEATLQRLESRSSSGHSNTTSSSSHRPSSGLSTRTSSDLELRKTVIEALVEQQGSFSMKDGSIHIDIPRSPPPDASKQQKKSTVIYDGRLVGPANSGIARNASPPLIIGHPYAQVQAHAANSYIPIGPARTSGHISSRNYHSLAPDPHSRTHHYSSEPPQAMSRRRSNIPDGTALSNASRRSHISLMPPAHRPCPPPPELLSPINSSITPTLVRVVPEPTLRCSKWDNSPPPRHSPSPPPHSPVHEALPPTRSDVRSINPIHVAAVPVPKSRVPIVQGPFVAPELRGTRSIRVTHRSIPPPDVPVDVRPPRAPEVYTAVRALRATEQRAPREFVESAWYSDEDSSSGSECSCD
ncbi:hypothetical protein CERSUDRAFT_92665 [Gelatoporia subvermispora B]|uniref:Uncharacterized protein n=1 Tax=Ceriporiopsis subvermispora (strain B) TaxID=914234 RepID=M2PTW3_CERS8|nr:hypothetical protein CERSUDRAFT_92665 [Gelatoporia subvermispora B]